ncbi:hypothetical protein PAXINDRAFT_7932 [Paxillus involutus ATCC 200175]|nr:hypothetical protein PAXINDRAFT_7932 [Paxillus involutus ATCC 200175]
MSSVNCDSKQVEAAPLADDKDGQQRNGKPDVTTHIPGPPTPHPSNTNRPTHHANPPHRCGQLKMTPTKVFIPFYKANFTFNNNGRPSSSTNEPQPEHSPPPLDMEMHFFGPAAKLYHNYHSKLTGRPCNAEGTFLPDRSSPPSLHNWSKDDWTPYRNRLEFELAHFLYMRNQMPEK